MDKCPQSNQWLKQMARNFTPATEIVLGYSNYEKVPGWFNKKITFDTLLNSMRYLGMAVSGHPYICLLYTSVTNYLQEQGVNAILLPALEFMRTDKNSEPDPVYIKEKLAAQLEIHPDAEIYITKGFICRNAYGEIDNLQRGGSDYTASLIGAAVNASEKFVVCR